MILRNNYLLVRQHLKDLKDICQLADSSVGRYEFYLRHLLEWAGETPLPKVMPLRPTFPGYVGSLPGRTGEASLAAISQKKIIETARRLFVWAKQNHPKEFSGLTPAWLESLRPPRNKDAQGEHEYVTLDEVLKLLAVSHSDGDLALLRDKAAAALLFLSGARASAFTTLPISAVDLPGRTLKQWPELGVATKNSKRATTFLLPIPELISMVDTWDNVVRNNLPESQPWYAPVKIHWGKQELDPSTPGKNRHQALDKRLRRLFDLAGAAYKSAHKFRHGHAVYGLQHAQTMADYKAVSMNLMHEDIKITDEIYAPILSHEVQLRISRLGGRPIDSTENRLESLARSLSNDELSTVMRIVAERLSS
ncbi:MAG: site-specific integrase [Anaerolineaceae bacterium]|nr:site-specific integrase [Anaerolineaceae bacterium]